MNVGFLFVFTEFNVHTYVLYELNKCTHIFILVRTHRHTDLDTPTRTHTHIYICIKYTCLYTYMFVNI